MTPTDFATLPRYKYDPRRKYSPEGRLLYAAQQADWHRTVVPSRVYRVPALGGWPGRLARIEAAALGVVEWAGVRR